MKKEGDLSSFDRNWKNRKESLYNHWSTGTPKNQIQFAFYNHWHTFKSIINNSRLFNEGNNVLEVGAGRGSLSAFFSANGYNTTLLDSSEKILETAKEIFDQNSLNAEYVLGNALSLPFNDKSFDIVFSVGLLEHFDDILKPISEQIRVLTNGGIWIGYIVPEMENNVQKEYKWVNEILKTYHKETNKEVPKEIVYRTSFNSSHYVRVLKELNLRSINFSGIYSVPMISHSIDFPFSLLNSQAEKILVGRFREIFKQRIKEGNENPWLCKEDYGNALLVWGIK